MRTAGDGSGFSNPILGGGGALIRPAIISPDWDGDPDAPLTTPGTIGWGLFRDGSAVLNNALIRGSLISGELHIPDTTSTSSAHIDASGNLWLGADASGFATAPARISASGIAVFTAVVISGSSIVGGANVGSGITASNITTGTLNASIVSVTNLNASNINTGTLNASIVTVTNLNASNITTGTLTGRTVQSSSSGTRIVVDASQRSIRWYNGSTERMRARLNISNFELGNISNALSIALISDTVGLTAGLANVVINAQAGSTTADLQQGGTTRVRASSSGAVLQRSATTSATGFADIGFGVVGTYSSRRRLKRGLEKLEPADSLARVLALGTPYRYTFRPEVLGGSPDPAIVELDEQLGFMAEDAAAVDRRLAVFDWLDPDDPDRLAPMSPPSTFRRRDDETLAQGRKRQAEHVAIEYAAELERYPLAAAVPTDWNVRAVVADHNGALIELHDRLAAIESRLGSSA